MMAYAEAELGSDAKVRYSAAISPPIFLFLTLLIAHLVDLRFGLPMRKLTGAMTQVGPMSGSVVSKMPAAVVEESEPNAGADPAGNRMRVVMRLNVEAVEALENVIRKKRRQIGRAVPMQTVLEEAIEDILRKYGEPVVVLPAPTKRGR